MGGMARSAVRCEGEGWMPVLQVKFYHPADDLMGLPPQAAAFEV